MSKFYKEIRFCKICRGRFIVKDSKKYYCDKCYAKYYARPPEEESNPIAENKELDKESKTNPQKSKELKKKATKSS